VLERVFAARQEATLAALRPVHEWCDSAGGPAALRTALTAAVGDYVSFLLARPSFARLIAWEELAGATRLRGTKRNSDALESAFAAIRATAPTRGLRDFEVDDAVLVFVGLAYTPVALRSTLMTALHRDLEDPGQRRRVVGLVVDQLTRLIV
jgi:hypothetical protein